MDKIWKDSPVPTPDASGQLPTSRGGDPNIDLGGASALQPIWSDPPVPTPDGGETANSVSGLPMAPARYQPTQDPPEPPSLQDRSPGTVDTK
jgi:hypothetical protein